MLDSFCVHFLTCGFFQGVVFQSVLNSYRSFMATSEETEEEEKEMFCDAFESELREFLILLFRSVCLQQAQLITQKMKDTLNMLTTATKMA